MARRFNDANSEYIYRQTAALASEPATYAAWFYSDDDSITQVILAVCDTDVDTDYLRLGLQGTVGGDPVRTYYRATVGAASADSTTGYSLNTWEHACGVCASKDDVRVYLNGGNKGADNTANSVDWSGVDNTSIGAQVWNSTVGGYISGRIAEAAIWNGALTDAEAALLYFRRYSPLKIRPQNLVAYWPLRHGDNADWLGRYGMIGVNTPSDIAHPPIVYPEHNDPVWGLVLPRYRPRHWWSLRPLPIIGSTTWGHVTGVVEDNTRPFDGKWSGTGDIERAGDDEQIALASGEYMESEVVNTGANLYEIDQNVYQAGDDVTVKFRHGATEAACLAAAFGAYVAPFDSLGFVQIRLESTL